MNWQTKDQNAVAWMRIKSLIYVNLGSAESNSTFVLEMSQRSSIHESNLSASDMEFHGPTLQNVMEFDNELNQQSRKWGQENAHFSQEEIEALPAGLDEEMIGIITMEDVMEELLQVSIMACVIIQFFQ